MTVTYDNTGGIAVVTIDNPPVNVIGREVREGLVAALDRAEAEGASRVIITGAGKTFVAGADAREFGAAPQPPHLPDILNRIETFAVPCIAAINGTALGGGLEIALACRARIAAPGAVLGLPEVTLGVVPGAGGTQRLPRITGIATAVSLISEGRSVKAAEALTLGIVDAVDADPVAAARTLSGAALTRPATSSLPMPAADDDAIAAARKQAARRMAGQIAPGIAIDLVAASATLPFAEGAVKEREAFLSLRTGPQAAALRHVFFAERAAMSQARTIPATPVDITSAVVVGGGTMGASIAYALTQIGIRVTLVETDAAAADRARVNVGKLYAEAVSRGKTTPEAAAAEQADRFAFAVGYDALPPAQIAIEAAFENMEVKRTIFAALDKALPGAVLATNTSYLDVNRIADAVADPSRVLGLHFFSPAHVMKLVEIIRAEATSDTALATAFRLAERLKKIPVRAGVCDGFIGNRILTRYRQVCDIMMIEGAMPWEIDAAMQGFGMAMGPYAVQDLSGLDIAYANRQRMGWKTKPGFRYIPIADRMVEELKRLGRKTNGGWYDYGGAKPEPSAAVETLVLDTSAQAGVTRRAFTAAEIVERGTTAMIDEGLRILDEGIAAKPSDIDLVMLHGYAFPRWRGGLMHYADSVGLLPLRDRIAGYAAQDPLSWSVPPILERLLEEGKRLSDLG